MGPYPVIAGTAGEDDGEEGEGGEDEVAKRQGVEEVGRYAGGDGE